MISTRRQKEMRYALAKDTPPPLHHLTTLEAHSTLVNKVKVGAAPVPAVDTVAAHAFL